MSDLTDLADRLAADLRVADAGGLLAWTEEELAAHLGRALAAYNALCPRRAEAILATSAGVRRYALEGLEGLLQVIDVAYVPRAHPDAAPERPARYRLPADGVLELTGNPPLGDGRDDLRVRYAARHTVAGLDGSEETTLPPGAAAMLLLGAGAQALEQAALSAVGAVTVGDAEARLRAHAAERTARYARALRAHAEALCMAQNATERMRDEG